MSDDRSSRLLQRGLDIVEYLAACPEPIGIRELAQQLDLSPSTCYRLLQILEERGYVQQDEPSRRWTLWLKPLELGMRRLNGPGLPSLARPHLNELMRATNETAFLGVRDGDWIVYIDVVLSQQALRTDVTLGSRWPLHSGALGKVLLSGLPDAEIDRILAGPLEAFTPHTIVEPAALRVELDEARVRGYALNHGETVTGVFCAAAPIFDHTRSVVAAIGAAGPEQRISPEARSAMIALVQSEAQQLSARLGYLLAGPPTQGTV
jgi:IclR family acetate operon transcriptional repressor